MTRFPRFPLFARILAWFSLNLLLLALAAVLFLQHQMRFGLEALLAGGAGDRLRSVAGLVHEELAAAPRAAWPELLAKFSRAYPLGFYVFSPRGPQLAGEPVILPEEIRARLREAGPPPPPRPPPFPENRPNHPPPPERPLALGGYLRAGDPPRYWIPVRPALPPQPGEGPATLILTTDSWNAGGLLFPLAPVLWTLAAALGFSALFWLPLIRGLTRSLGEMNAATARIAAGDFATPVPLRRTDELGALGRAINAMAERLAGLLHGQRRFLSDVAHELCAPLSRLQLSLGILENQERQAAVTPAQLHDVREEVDQIAALVNELLFFSRAEAGAHAPELRPIPLRALIERTLAREHLAESACQIRAAENLSALAEPDLLQRALANLLRNAAHYAAGCGPITIEASAAGGAVQLTVRDAGPGVPAAALPQLFDPFFRVDPSRTRATGGVGLGLTIARRCVEACRGTISARLAQPSGLEITIRLPAADAP